MNSLRSKFEISKVYTIRLIRYDIGIQKKLSLRQRLISFADFPDFFEKFVSFQWGLHKRSNKKIWPRRFGNFQLFHSPLNPTISSVCVYYRSLKYTRDTTSLGVVFKFNGLKQTNRNTDRHAEYHVFMK